MDGKTDLKTFVKILLRRKVTIAITLVCFLIFTVIVSVFVMKPTYEATENIVVGKLKKEEGYYGETQEVYMLLASTKDFIKSPTVLNSVQKDLNFKDEKLEDKIVVKNNKDSQIISVIVRGNSPKKTQLISETIVNTTVDKMNALFGVSEIKVLANTEEHPAVKRVGSTVLNIAIGGIIGLFFGIGLALLQEFLDDSIKDSKEVEELLGIRLLGHVQLGGEMEGDDQHHLHVEFAKGEERGGLSV